MPPRHQFGPVLVDISSDRLSIDGELVRACDLGKFAADDHDRLGSAAVRWRSAAGLLDRQRADGSRVG